MSRFKKRNKPAEPADYSKIEKRIKDVGDFDPEGKIVIYGPPGVGKTTLLATFPKPLLLLDMKERGTDSIRDVKGVKVLRVRTWEEFEQAYWYLRDHQDDYETVGIDTVSYAQEMCITHILERNKKGLAKGKNPGDWGTMTKRDWGAVAGLMKPMITNFRDLEMNVVFIAHDRVFGGGDEDEDEDDVPAQVGPRLMPSVASVLNGSVGVIGSMFKRNRKKKIKGKKGKDTGEKLVVDYCIRVGPHDRFITKVRKPRDQELPDIIVDPEYNDIIGLITGEE